jgi:hypothetical protein
MILRSIIERLRGQQWTAIAIEFVIVVLGVFVGIEVSNWNAARLERQRGAEFTGRLIDDLREEAWIYQYYVEYYGDVLASAERALDILEGRTAASDETLLVNAYRATQYRRAVRRRATYDELTSTGAIGLIEERALRETAMRVYTSLMFDTTANEGVASRYRERFRMIVPVATQAALARACGDRLVEIGNYDSIVDSLDYACDTGLSREAQRQTATILRTDEALTPLLRLRIADLRTRLAELNTFNPDIERGLQDIASRTRRER